MFKGNAYFLLLYNKIKCLTRLCHVSLNNQENANNRIISLAGPDDCTYYNYCKWLQKNNHSVFLIFQKICKKKKNQRKNYISGILWHSKVNYRWYMRILTLLFLSDSNNSFLCLISNFHISIHFFSLFLFHLFLYTLIHTRHILKFKMFHSMPL